MLLGCLGGKRGIEPGILRDLNVYTREKETALESIGCSSRHYGTSKPDGAIQIVSSRGEVGFV